MNQSATLCTCAILIFLRLCTNDGIGMILPRSLFLWSILLGDLVDKIYSKSFQGPCLLTRRITYILNIIASNNNVSGYFVQLKAECFTALSDDITARKPQSLCGFPSECKINDSLSCPNPLSSVSRMRNDAERNSNTLQWSKAKRFYQLLTAFKKGVKTLNE